MEVSAIIAALGGDTAVAEATGAKPNTVAYWRRRQSIPAEHWLTLVDLAQKQDVGVDLRTLAADAAAKKSRAPQPAEAAQ